MPRHYPHLLPEDKELWVDFLNSPNHIHTRYLYDIKVGEGRDPGENFPQYIRDMALNISKRRIDAIAFNGERPTIIEISVNAGLTQLGQLMAYPCLYKIQNPTTLPPQRLLVARSIQTDIEPVLIDQKIPYIIVPVAER